ncbi:MAG: hypothetical protein DRP47_02160 [Candidatus Zixiibacteriota bacterium]|nr:MAG: hypothetical protein DRP47_02160 [candidate division Zixibacteria bacterium]
MIEKVCFFLFFGVVFVLSIIMTTGCTKPPIPVANQPSLHQSYWEKIWVDPQIFLSEAQYTLIRSDRVDSMYHEKGETWNSPRIPSLEFTIDDDSCIVSISFLHSLDHSIVAPMIVRFLPHGHYKFTPTSGIDLGTIRAGEPYFIKATICDRDKIVPVIR